MAEHNELGKLGEQKAYEYLIGEGLKVLERNWRNSRLEVDLIATEGDFLVLVEVKARNTVFFGAPDSFVGSKKQNMMAEAAEVYMEKHPEIAGEVRYDIVSVVIEKGIVKSLEHIRDAFFPDDLNLRGIDF